jgi:predicted Rossmann fold flavoprotein
VVVVGGGAAGFFGAIACAEASPGTEIILLERSGQVLQKVRISGGGRCNVTHACFDPRDFSRNYPRGEREMIGPYHQFQAEDTVRWFEARGVKLKTEADGRMFPVSNSSQTIIDCLLDQARQFHIRVRTNAGVRSAAVGPAGRFILSLDQGETLECDRVLLATGGCRTAALEGLAVGLGHTLIPPVPSLFTFHIEAPWVRDLAGLSVPKASLNVPGTRFSCVGPVLFTHWGLSGPAVLKLSAWGARALHEKQYQFLLRINWLGESLESTHALLESHAREQSSRQVINAGLTLPGRLWRALVAQALIPAERRWGTISRAELRRLAQALSATELGVRGKSLNKEEFVTCGGVALPEVNFKTMESRICPGLYFAGELLDLDGITGGFNFQAAWTTGWIAGRSIATSLAVANSP